VNNADRTMNTL